MKTLVVVSGPDKDRLLPLTRAMMTLGSSPVADHRLSDPRISDFHATVTLDARGRVYRHDTSVRDDGLRATGRRLPRVVPMESVIRFGDTALRLTDVPAEQIIQLVEESGARALRTERVVYLRVTMG